MKQVNTHKRTLVAAGIAAALGMQTTSVFAAEETDKDVEVIEIKGIRGSVTKSMDLKRSAQGIVDAITAEDIGKMPDTNLAESLQRITGVSIDRQNNEGSRVTVRGWGPEFNLITLNGRQMPAANLSATSVDTRRSYDFSNLAAESVSGVQIYKTGKANVSTGGIGAVINIETFKPLKNPGLTASVGVKGIMDDVRIGDDITPEISGIFSNTFAEDTVGISLTASRSVRDNHQAAARVPGGWNTSINANGNIEGAPQNFMYTFEDFSRTRTNAQLTLQFRPSDRITATVDYTYSELDTDVERQELSAWFGNGNFSGGNGVDDWATTYVPVDANNVTSPAVLYNGDCCDVSAGVGSWGTTNESESLGFNVEFDVTENLSLTLDYHSSSAEAMPKDHRGSNNVVTATQFRRNESVVDFTQDIPILQMFVTETLAPFDPAASLNGELDPSLIIPSGISFRNGYMKTEIEQVQFDGEYVFDDGIISSVNFGFMSQTMDNQTAFSLNQGGDWGNGIGGSCGEAGGWGTPCGDGDGHYADEAFTIADLTAFPGAGVDGKMVWVDYNQFGQDIYNWYLTSAVNPFADCPEGTLCVNPNYDTDMRLTEEQTAFYVQANLEFELAGMLTTVNVGVRHEETKVESNSLIPNYVSGVWQSPNELILTQDPEFQNFANGEGDYSYVLPNIDFNIELTDDIVARASFSKSIARGGYGSLQAGAVPSSSQARTFDASTANAGDPSLKPYESDNFDLSIEYYYDEGSYVSAGYYAKTVYNFHSSINSQEVIYPNLLNPASGPRLAEAQAQVVNQGNAANEIHAYYVAQGWISLPSGALEGDTSSYSPLTYTVTRPINSREAEVDGFEIAAQHIFGDSGFGAQINYTTVDSDLVYDNSILGPGQFALPGLSDTANFVGFYDKDGLQIRIAYNWRDEFMNSTLGGSGNGQDEPGYVEAYGQVDLSVSYQVTEDLSVSFEGINVTEESTRTNARGSSMMVYAAEQSARYAVGVRYNF